MYCYTKPVTDQITNITDSELEEKKSLKKNYQTHEEDDNVINPEFNSLIQLPNKTNDKRSILLGNNKDLDGIMPSSFKYNNYSQYRDIENENNNCNGLIQKNISEAQIYNKLFALNSSKHY